MTTGVCDFNLLCKLNDYSDSSFPTAFGMDWTGMEWIALSSPIVRYQSDGRDQLK